ncbi:MAG: histidine kinase [Crocinitomicaceae bacterium]|nr:histidine kinase [Crocinitomicaceae bacterium]
MVKLICTLLLFLLAYFPYAQEYASVDYTTEDGLPTNEIWNVVEDTNGYIFFGSGEGLVRYDGKNFKVFDDFSSIDINASYLTVDERNQIWFANFTSELFCYHNGEIQKINITGPNAEKLELTSLRNIRNIENFIHLRARSSETGRKYNLKIEISSRKYTINKISTSKFDVQLTKNTVLTKCKFYDDSCRGFRIVELQKEGEDQKRKLIKTYAFHDTSLELMTSVRKTKSCKDKYFCFTSTDIKTGKQEVYILNLKTHSLTKIKLSNEASDVPFIPNVFSSFENHFLLGTNKGLLIINKYGTVLKSLYEKYEIGDIEIDKFKNIWLTTPTNGAFRIQNTKLLTYKNDHPAYAVSNGKICNKSQLANFKGSNNTYIKQSKNELVLSNEQKCYILSRHHNVHLNKKYPNASKDVAIDDCKNILIANHEGLAILFKEPNNKKKRYYNKLALEWDKYNSLKKSKKKIYNTLSLIYSTKQNYNGQYYLEYGLTIGKMKYIAIEGENLYFHSHASGEVFHFNGTTLEKYDFDRRISSLFIVDNVLHIPTKNDGVYLLKKHQIKPDKSINSFLKHHKIKKVVFENDLYWILDRNTLIKVSKAKKNASYFDYRSGTDKQEFKDFLITNDTIYLAAEEGIITVPMNFKFHKTPEITPKLEWIKDQSNFLTPKFITKKELLNLAHDNKGVIIKVGTAEYRDQNSASFEYRLIGTNDLWISISDNSIYIDQLNPGEYQLEIRCTMDGLPIGKTLKLPINVNPPWYFLWWVILIYVLILLSLIILFILWRLSIVQRKNDIEFSLIELKQQALQAQMNPHFIFNTLNAVQRFMLENDQEKALRYLSKFSRLIRQVFEFNNQQFIPIKEEINFLELYLELEERRFHPNVKVKFLKDELSTIDPNLKIPALIIQPIVENAFKHGLKQDGKDEVSIILNHKENLLNVSVLDTGKGINNSSNIGRKGSLKLNSERLSIFTKKGYKTGIFATNRYNSKQEIIGTKVLINIPIINEN